VDTLRFASFKQDRGKPFRVLLAARLLWEKGTRLNTPAVCRRFGMVGRKKVLEEFDERILFHKIQAVYRELWT